MSLYIYPYKMGSKSAAALAKALGCQQIRHVGSTFKGSNRHTVINWGASELPQQVHNSKVLNSQEAVRCAGNKLTFFKRLSVDNGPNLVPWTTDKTAAQSWLDKGSIAVVRTLLSSHSGRGIIIVEPGQTLPDASLYTKYVPKDSEWRIHIFNGEVIDVQRKIRDPNREPTNWKVRSHESGFIYIRNTIDCPDGVFTQARLAYNLSGLMFGAFDVIFNKKQNKAFILEGNTACGLEGATVEIYDNAFKKLLRSN